MTSYLGKHQPAQEPQARDEDQDFSVNDEDVSDNIDQLNGSFETFKKTVSCSAVYEQIREFEEINKRLDR